MAYQGYQQGYRQEPHLGYQQGYQQGYPPAMGYPPEKQSLAHAHVQDYGPVHDDLGQRVDYLRETNDKWRNYAQVMNFIYRLAATLLSGFVLGALIWALIQYLTTKHLALKDGTQVWPSDLVLWPTYLLLGVSLITFVTNGLMLFVPCMHRNKRKGNYDSVSPYERGNVKAARKRTNTFLSWSQYLALAGYFVAWAVSSGLYQFAKTGNDLWGCTCSSTATQIQPQVASFLDFGRLCSVQKASWNVMIAQAAVWALAGMTYMIAAYRWRRRRELKRLEQQHEIRQSVISYVP